MISEATREKLRQSHLGQVPWNKGRPDSRLAEAMKRRYERPGERERASARWPDPAVAAAKCVMSLYRTGATKRELDFTLDPVEFFRMIGEDCFYCSAPPSNVYTGVKRLGVVVPFAYSGVDRVDNFLGYVPGNVVPCCIKCNTIKSAVPVSMCRRICEHLDRTARTDWKADPPLPDVPNEEAG